MRPLTAVVPALAASLLLSCAPGSSPEPTASPPAAPDQGAFDIAGFVPEELMLQANQGRRVFADDGTFAFPPRVRRVWIDVGAHLLQTTGRQFLDHEDIGLIIFPTRFKARTAPLDVLATFTYPKTANAPLQGPERPPLAPCLGWPQPAKLGHTKPPLLGRRSKL